MLNYQLLLIGTQVAITAAFLLYSSWSDYKTREVSNRVWAIYAPIAITLTLSNFLLFNPSKLVTNLTLFGVSAGFTVGLAFCCSMQAPSAEPTQKPSCASRFPCPLPPSPSSRPS